MPDFDGIQVCRQLKQDSRTRDIPVIFSSGVNDVLEKNEALKAGGVAYVIKPFQAEELLILIEKNL